MLPAACPAAQKLFTIFLYDNAFMCSKVAISMVYLSGAKRGLGAPCLALILTACSTDALMPPSNVDNGTVNAIAVPPRSQTIPAATRQMSYPVAGPSDAVQSQNLAEARPPATLPMIDSEEAGFLLEDRSPGAQEPVAGLAGEQALQIAEGATTEPVVTGIGTGQPQLMMASAAQPSANASDLPVTWSDGTPVTEPSRHLPEQEEQQVAMLPRPVTPQTPAPAVQAPAPMSAADISCRRELQKLGGMFSDMEPISDGPSCGIAHPVRLSGLGGGAIAIKPAATLNCQLALQFAKWVKQELVPSARLRYWSGVRSIRQMSSYSCRKMNSRASNPWSEHARGNAIDIGEITLNSGKTIDIEKKGFFEFREKALLKAVRTDSCNYFNTVLGPGSDPSHKDHFHFDLRDRKSGIRYCSVK